MSQEYFSHDIHANRDTKMVRMFCKWGHQGRGLFWDVVALLHEQRNAVAYHSQCERTAAAMLVQCDVSTFEKFIKECVDEFNLFKIEGGKLTSERVAENLEKRKEKSDKARKSALLRHSCERNANAQHESPRAVRISAIKVKESKGKEKKKRAALSDPDLFGDPPTPKDKSLPEPLREFLTAQGCEPVEDYPNIYLPPGALEGLKVAHSNSGVLDRALASLQAWSESHDINPKTNKPGWYEFRRKRDHFKTLINQIKRIQASEA